jgi:hypothetical protein
LRELNWQIRAGRTAAVCVDSSRKIGNETADGKVPLDLTAPPEDGSDERLQRLCATAWNTGSAAMRLRGNALQTKGQRDQADNSRKQPTRFSDNISLF